jgi:hypothetical protein
MIITPPVNHILQSYSIQENGPEYESTKK